MGKIRFRESNYFISEDGEVYSDKPSGLKKMSVKLDRDGYYNVGLNLNKSRKFFKVHRLVAECYISNSDNLPQVNHLNGIKTDNNIKNLEWVTQSENVKHAYRLGLKKSGEEHHKSKLNNEQVQWIRENYIYKDSKFGSISLGKKFNVGHATILRIIKNKTYAKK